MNFKVYVINLEKDTDRMDHMRDQFKKQDVPFTRISGINGRTLDTSNLYDNKRSLEENGYSLSPGEIGCSLSHKKCWQTFLEDIKTENISHALICEDDIEINSPEFKKIIDQCIKENQIQKTWNYLQFNYQEPGAPWAYAWWIQVKKRFLSITTISGRSIFVLQSILKLPIVVLFGIFEFIRNTFYKGPVNFYRDMYLAGCYLIDADGAKKLLSLSEKIVYPADKIHNEAKIKSNLVIRYYCPAIVHQNRTKFTTNIGS